MRIEWRHYEVARKVEAEQRLLNRKTIPIVPFHHDIGSDARWARNTRLRIWICAVRPDLNA
jgi:hypothetical protein